MAERRANIIITVSLYKAVVDCAGYTRGVARARDALLSECNSSLSEGVLTYNCDALLCECNSSLSEDVLTYN